MGELRATKRKKNSRINIGHRDGNQNKTVIISLSISHVSILLLNGICWRLTQPNDRFGIIGEYIRKVFFIHIDKIGDFCVNLHYEYKEYEVV